MGLRCLLTSVNTTETPYPVYPLGLAHVAGSLIAHGHTVRQLDRLSNRDSYFQNLQEIIAELRPELIGISIRNLDLEDSAKPQSFLTTVKEVVDFIRLHSNAPIVLGGPAFSLLPEKILTLLQADYGIIGEGEKALPWLARQLQELNPPTEKLINIPPQNHPWQQVYYDKTISAYYTDIGGMMNLQTKRGCPYRCNYCSYPLLEGKKIRKKDPKQVAVEAIQLKEKYGAQYLFFTDSVFNDTEGHFLDICRALIEVKNSLPWTAYFRPADLDAATMELMKQSGLDAMEIGTDSGCDHTLAALQKSFTFDAAVRLNQMADRFHIPCAHFIMFGGPGEDKETLHQSLNNIEQLRPSVVFAFNGIRILPNTGIHTLAVHQGIIDKNDDLLEPKFYFSPAISQEEIDRELRHRWQNRPDRIYPGSDSIGLIKQFHAKGHVGPIWDKIIRKGLARV
jgi:radical SAM superfamily enzyme YgiQ (UPF0313 family)